MNKQAFTLVELIVAITILAILGTIAYISMQSYSASSRDSVRISDLSTIKTGLGLYELESGKYPEPTNGVNITYSGVTVWTQGTYGETMGVNVDKLNKIPLDPLVEKQYTYSVTLNKREYNLGGIIEGDEIVMLNNVLQQTNAGETTINAIVTGTYNGKILKTLSGTICSVIALPTIITNDTNASTDLQEILENKNLVYNGYNNLPSSFKDSKFKNDGGFEYEPNKFLVYNDSISCSTLSQSEQERIGLLKNLQDNYSGTILNQNEDYVELINTDINLFSPNNATKLISRAIVGNTLSLKLSEESLTFLNCEGGIINGYTYGNIAHGLGENVTKEELITNGTKNYGAQAVCNNGNIEITNENINILCNSGYVDQAGICVQDVCNGTIPTNAQSTATSQNVSTTWTNNSTPGICTFKCDTNYTWNTTTTQCESDTQNTNCTQLPTNAQWNTTNNITQTWNGTNWLPLEIGSYDTNASTTECKFKCDTNYTWNGSECIADTKITTCGGSVKANSTATTTNTYTQTWNGTTWTPTTNWGENQTTCDFDCDTNYTWNGTTSQCEADTKPLQACTGKPSNSVYNTATNITQTWNGTIWTPSTTSIYNTTPSTTSCNYKCDTNYTWNTTMCGADTKTTTCGGSVVANATATTSTTYSQLWNGTEWTPTTSWGEFQSTCDFDCGTNYTWNGTSCVADSKIAQACTGKPANSLYNTATSITQTWNGTTWLPSTTSVYNITTSTTNCNYKCDTNYTWNSTTSQCIADTQTTTCGGSVVSNATATTATTYSQLWNGTAWTPTTSWGESQSTCDFDCNANYTWNGTSCIINSYTITFNGNTSTSGTMSNQTIATNATSNLTTNAFVKTGYTFAGWATTAGGAVEYLDGASYTMGTSSVTLYAKWTEIINGACGTGDGKSRVNAPSTDRCNAGTAGTVTTSGGNHTWSCTGSNGGTTASCSATQLLPPTAGINTLSQTSITWAWSSGGGTATKYEWSPNGSTWTNKLTSLSHSETSLTCNTPYSSRLVRACDDLGNCTGNRTLTSSTTTVCPVNGACGTGDGKSRVNAPSTDRCNAGTAGTVTTGATTYTWSCTGSNGGTTDSCSANILKVPTAGTNTLSQTSITWAWSSGGGTATKYEWSPNGSTWTNKSTSLSHSETSLTCNTSYSSRLVRACDDLGTCTGNRTLTSATTTTCPFSCGTSITYGGFTYTTKLGLDGNCWTSTNMKHTPTSGSSTCYNNTASNCTTYSRLYDRYAATHSSVCPALGTGWALPTDVQWTNLTNAGATGWTGNKLSGIVSTLPGYYNTAAFYNLGSSGYWWSSTQYDTTNAYGRHLHFDHSLVNRVPYTKNISLSVVCIKN